ISFQDESLKRSLSDSYLNHVTKLSLRSSSLPNLQLITKHHPIVRSKVNRAATPFEVNNNLSQFVYSFEIPSSGTDFDDDSERAYCYSPGEDTSEAFSYDDFSIETPSITESQIDAGIHSFIGLLRKRGMHDISDISDMNTSNISHFTKSRCQATRQISMSSHHSSLD
ncbi:unnamed protein product, partial [Meganyctiphanes norvegica]